MRFAGVRVFSGSLGRSVNICERIAGRGDMNHFAERRSDWFRSRGWALLICCWNSRITRVAMQET